MSRYRQDYNSTTVQLSSSSWIKISSLGGHDNIAVYNQGVANDGVTNCFIEVNFIQSNTTAVPTTDGKLLALGEGVELPLTSHLDCYCRSTTTNATVFYADWEAKIL